MAKIEEAEKLVADKKAAARYLKHEADVIESRLAKNFAGGFYSLAANDARELLVALQALAQIDIH